MFLVNLSLDAMRVDTRKPDSKFNLANFMSSYIFSICSTKYRTNILYKENVDKQCSRTRWYFQNKGVAQVILATMKSPVSVMETAGEGGAGNCPAS